MANDHWVKQAFELEMIKADVEFYHQLLMAISGEEVSGILSFGLIPYLSLFVVETYNYFCSSFPNFANVARRKHEDILCASRTRVKLFDDTRKDVVSQVDHLRWILDFCHSWMNSKHVGLLGWVKRLIQTDMGLFFYGDHLVCTTQAALFNLGFEKGDLATTQRGEPVDLPHLSRSIGYDIGEYLGFLLDRSADTSNKSNTTLCAYHLTNSQFQCEDHKAQQYLRDMYNGKETLHLNSCLLLFLTTINFLVYVFSQLVINSPDTWFKVKFITLYHVISGVKKLQNYFYKRFSKRSKGYLSRLIGDSEMKELLNHKLPFRNIMVHYEIRDVPEGSLDPSVRYFGLVESCFDGLRFRDVNEMIDRQLLRVSNVLEAWQSQTSL